MMGVVVYPSQLGLMVASCHDPIGYHIKKNKDFFRYFLADMSAENQKGVMSIDFEQQLT